MLNGIAAVSAASLFEGDCTPGGEVLLADLMLT